jgi:hypothetical protein
MLMDCEVLTSAEIWTKLIIRQGTTDVEVESDRTLLKIEQDEQELNIYVPVDPVQQQLCYRTQMPAQLMKLLGINVTGAEKQIYRILTEPASQLDRIMVEEDIPTVLWLERVAVCEDEETGWSRAPADLTTALTVDGDAILQYSSRASPLAPASPSTQSYVVDAFPLARYRRVLEHVVRHAQKIPQKPALQTEDRFSTRSLQESLDEIGQPMSLQDFGIVPGQPMTFEARARIGAAGELYVSPS